MVGLAKAIIFDHPVVVKAGEVLLVHFPPGWETQDERDVRVRTEVLPDDAKVDGLCIGPGVDLFSIGYADHALTEREIEQLEDEVWRPDRW